MKVVATGLPKAVATTITSLTSSAQTKLNLQSVELGILGLVLKGATVDCRIGLQQHQQQQLLYCFIVLTRWSFKMVTMSYPIY